MKQIMKLSAVGCALAAALSTVASFSSSNDANAAALPANSSTVALATNPPALPDPAPYIHPANGGPTSPQAQALEAQFPTDTVDTKIYGEDVLTYGKLIGYLFPDAKTEFNEVAAFGKCGIDYGVFDARFYVDPHLTSLAAVAVIIVTAESAGSLIKFGAECVAHQVVSGGGPTTGSNSSQLATLFEYSNTTGTYYVMIAATNPGGFTSFYDWFSRRFALYAA